MRVPVYARGADPRTSSPILRQSLGYAIKQVEEFVADWVDPSNLRKGIIPREFLPSGKALPVTVNELKTRFVANTRVLQPDRPTHYQNEDIVALRIHPKAVVLPSWDWSKEPALA